MTIISLFDGSGGFPLAATIYGMIPLYASEIEPYPIAVTRSRFPQMTHLGDVSRVNGAELTPADVITFGSPCQSLSVAGKREGLRHTDLGDEETTRSGLFVEAVRIITEMRIATDGKYPRFAVWENVPGAFSSSNGDDFLAVLTALAKIADPEVSIPKSPKWSNAGEIVGDGWSLAWRVLDAQYFGKTVRDGDTGDVLVRGTPQRRRRIFLVADLAGQRAGEVLLERNGLPWNYPPCDEPWQTAAADAEGSVGADDRAGCLTPWDSQSKRVFASDAVFPSLYSGESAGQSQQTVCYGISAYESNAMKSDNPHSGIYEADTSRTLDLNGGNPACNQGGMAVVCLQGSMIGRADKNGPQGDGINEDVCFTLNTTDRHAVVESAGFKELNSAKARSDGYEYEKSPCLSANKIDASVCIKLHALFENHSQDSRYKDPLDVSPMLPAQLGTGGNNTPLVVSEGINGDVSGTLDASYYKGCVLRNGVERDVIAIDRASFNQGQNAQYEPQYLDDGTNPTIVAKGPTIVAKGPSGVCYGDNHRYIVRRLTPTECARLQGFPDEWGRPDYKEDFTDEEYTFWLDVRNTYAKINDKPVKDYTKAQMLTWYNKLHTDSAEYKMWGNGVNLPCVLFVMKGIADILREGETDA